MTYKLYFPTPWDEVNSENDNIDVCMSFPDGRSYTFVVATLENVRILISQEGTSYLSPASRFLIVEKLTESIVMRLIAELSEDESLLKYYGSDL